MIRSAGLVLVAAILAAVLSVANLPLAAVAGWAGLHKAGLSYARAEGTLWRGVLVGARFNGHALGDVTVAAKPAALLAGRASMSFAMDGDGVLGRGGAAVGLDRRVRIMDARFLVDLDRFSYYFSELPFGGAVEADVRSLTFGPRGCEVADARIATDAFKETAAAMRGEAPVLDGPLRCDGDALLADLAGGADNDRVALTARLGPDLSYALRLSVRTDDPSVSSLLPMLGFMGEDDQFNYALDGKLAAARGVQS
ncbi:MAG: type II secretion system protein N [Pseudomonadota bacterium]